jgi:putative ABC transport system permease protein
LFDWDKWQEIIATARKNKLRTVLTVFGVFWGMFMLLLMLGFGGSLEMSIRSNMRGFATNAVYVWGQSTSIPHKGLQPGRRLQFTNDDAGAIQREVGGIDHFAPRNQLGGHRDGNNVTRGVKTGNFQVMGDYPAFQYIQPVRFEKGRFINDNDIEERRKVAVIGRGVYDVLYERGEDPIGSYVKAHGVYFQVIGLFRPRQAGDRGERAANSIHIPFSTFQQTFNYGNRVGWFSVTGTADVSAIQLEKDIRKVLMTRHKVHPDDDHSVGSFNAEEEFGKVQTLFMGIKLFVWFVGIMTLLAGVIGVSNIMLIVVKERTKEIGVRKALGAPPWSIISLILQESVVLTSLAGYVGVIVAVLVTEGLGILIGDGGSFAKPRIDFDVAVLGAVVLVVTGAMAGIIPARHAVSISPVEALRSE